MEPNLTARRLRQCREEQQETLEQLGRLAGVNKSTVMRWERGDTSKINLPTVYLLAQHFRVDPQWLLGLTDEVGSCPTPLAAPDVVPVPVMGAVRAGLGGLSLEDPSGHRAGGCRPAARRRRIFLAAGHRGQHDPSHQ